MKDYVESEKDSGLNDRKFLIDEEVCSYEEAFIANREDFEVVSWLSICRVGETFGVAKRIS